MATRMVASLRAINTGGRRLSNDQLLAPFTADDLAATEGRAQITFLATAPGPAQVDDALALVPDEDRVVFVEREWFWLPRTGVSGSALPVGQIERIVGPMTMRTVGTVQRLLARFGT